MVHALAGCGCPRKRTFRLRRNPAHPPYRAGGSSRLARSGSQFAQFCQPRPGNRRHSLFVCILSNISSPCSFLAVPFAFIQSEGVRCLLIPSGRVGGACSVTRQRWRTWPAATWSNHGFAKRAATSSRSGARFEDVLQRLKVVGDVSLYGA